MKYYDKCHDIFFVVDVNLCVQYVNLVYYKPIFQFHSNLVHVIQISSVYNFYEKYICALMVLFLFARTMQPDSLFEWRPVCGWKHPEMCLSIWVPGVALSVWWVKTGKHFKKNLKNLTELYFTTNDKQVLQLK